MLQAFVITLREGLEAFLIVAISLAYLRKSGRRELIPAVHWGIAASVLISMGAGYLLQQAANQALWEGVLALAAAASVATLTVHMWRSARRIKRDIEGHLHTSAQQQGAAAFLGVFGFTLLMITREGMETALLMGTLVQMQAGGILVGATLGIAVSAFVAFLWSRYGHQVNLGLFFQVTAVFLLVFVVQLVIYGVHEMSEAFMRLPVAEWIHWTTEPYGPDGRYGQYLTYLLVALPIAWLAGSSLVGRRSLGGHRTLETVRN